MDEITETMEITPAPPVESPPPAEPPTPRARNSDWLKRNWLVALVIANTLIAVTALVLALAYTGGGAGVTLPNGGLQENPGAPGKQGGPGQQGRQPGRQDDKGQQAQPRGGPAGANAGVEILSALGVDIDGAAAQALGVMAQDLLKELESGKTIAQVVQEKGLVTEQFIADLEAKINEAVDSTLDEIVRRYIEQGASKVTPGNVPPGELGPPSG